MMGFILESGGHQLIIVLCVPVILGGFWWITETEPYQLEI
jgi:hypothetical protein